MKKKPPPDPFDGALVEGVLACARAFEDFVVVLVAAHEKAAEYCRESVKGLRAAEAEALRKLRAEKRTR